MVVISIFLTDCVNPCRQSGQINPIYYFCSISAMGIKRGTAKEDKQLKALPPGAV